MRTRNAALAAALADKGIRHDWFAARLGISKWMLSHYLAGRRTPPDRFYREAALILGVPEAWVRPAQPSRVEVAGLETLALTAPDAEVAA